MACSCRRKKSKMEISLGSHFQFFLEPWVINVPLCCLWLKQELRSLSCLINKQNESLELLSFYFHCVAGSANKGCLSSIARTFWLYERLKRKKSEIKTYSVYKGNWNAINRIEIQLDVSGEWVKIAVGEVSWNFWDNSSQTINII